jgi:pimeloyl-ACP methyl ester carboxylesterase
MNVDVNGTRLWFDVDGAGLVPEGPAMRERPTVVLLHGGPGSFDHTYFKPEFSRLAEVAQVVYLDLPGHGRSQWGDPESWSFEACADDVRGFCDALSIARPVVYGHSLGGFVAMVYGARHPGHAAGLVLHSTMARFDLDRLVEDFRRAGGDEVASVAERVYGGDSESVTDEEWAPCWALFGPWVTGEQERARTTVNRELNAPGLVLMRSFDAVDRLGAIDCPTLVCVGELDPMTSVAAAQEIAEALPAAVVRLEVIEGAGHFSWMDAPERFWPLLLDFVASVGARDA